MALRASSKSWVILALMSTVTMPAASAIDTTSSVLTSGGNIFAALHLPSRTRSWVNQDFLVRACAGSFRIQLLWLVGTADLPKPA